VQNSLICKKIVLKQDFCTLKTDTPNSSIIVKPAPNGWLEAIPNPPHLERVQVKQQPPDPEDS